MVKGNSKINGFASHHRRSLIAVAISLCGIMQVSLLYSCSKKTFCSESLWIRPAQSKNKRNKNKPKLLLHVGPLKTGTTTIQESVLRNQNISRALKEMDNVSVCQKPRYYAFIDKVNKDCLARGPKNCNETLWQEFQDLVDMDLYRSNHTTSLHSCEDLSKLPNTAFAKSRLRSFQKKWDVQVIVSYRRLVDWMISFYHQVRRAHPVHGMYIAGQWLPYPEASEDDIQLFTFPVYFAERFGALRDSLATKDFYEEVYGKGSVTMIQMDAEDGMAAEFLCNGVGSNTAPHACKAAEHWKNERKNSNDRYKFEHDLLALEAYRTNHIRGEAFVGRHEATEIIHARLEEKNLTVADLPQTCITGEQEELLWQRMLHMEKALAASPVSEETLRRVFDEKRPMLCSVDAPAIMRNVSLRENLFPACAFLKLTSP